MELLDLQVLMNDKKLDIPAFFHGVAGQTDLRWSLKQLDGLPDNIIAALYRQYLRLRTQCRDGLARSANIWLRERVGWFRKLLHAFPVELHALRTDEQRAAVAVDWANQVAMVFQQVTVGETEPQEPELLFRLMSEPVAQWGFVPVQPKFRDHERMLVWIAAMLARFLDSAWWLRKINRCWDRYTEHAAILIGKVRRGVSSYISHQNLNVYRQRKAAGYRWMQQMMVINPDYDLELPLHEAVAASVSNPQIRRHELMVRMRGFEDLAADIGYRGVFITWTAPGQYHAWKQLLSGKVVENPKYIGSSPRQTQAYLSSLWVKCRAKLARAHIPMFGFRVTEPHHDGTPHWHMLLFIHPDFMAQAIAIMRQYAIRDAQEELLRHRDKYGRHSPVYFDPTPRFDYKVMDPQAGGATGYIAKYIAKNLDGFGMDEDYESGQIAEDGALSAGAWACWHGIRQFQQIGGPSVSVWRELRRLKDPAGPSRDQVLEAIRRAADSGDWKSYVSLMGGPVLPRADRPVRLLQLTKDNPNPYGEEVSRIVGVLGQVEERRTRLDGWHISHQGLPSKTQSSPSGFESFAFAGQAHGRAPWSSDNNCTGNPKKPHKSELEHHVKLLGLDAFMTGRLRAGSVISDNGRYIWLKHGQLQVSDRHPTQRDPDYEFNLAIEGELRAERRTRVTEIRREMWQLIAQPQLVDAWFDSHTEDERTIAIEQMKEIVDLHEQEQAMHRYHEKLKSLPQRKR